MRRGLQRRLTRVNADLADNLGNLVSRVTKFAAAQFDGRAPTQGTPNEAEAALAGRATAILEACAADFEAIRLRKACGRLRALWSLGNDYVTSNLGRPSGRTRRARTV